MCWYRFSLLQLLTILSFGSSHSKHHVFHIRFCCLDRFLGTNFCMAFQSISSYKVFQTICTPQSISKSATLLISMVTELMYFQLTLQTVKFTALVALDLFLVMNGQVLWEAMLSSEWLFTDLTGVHISLWVSHLGGNLQKAVSVSTWRMTLSAAMSYFYRLGWVHYILGVSAPPYWWTQLQRCPSIKYEGSNIDETLSSIWICMMCDSFSFMHLHHHRRHHYHPQVHHHSKNQWHLVWDIFVF